MSNSSIWHIDRTLWGATTPGQSGSERDGNERVLHIPQSSSITGDLSSDCLVSYQDTRWGSFTPLQRGIQCILQPLPSWLGHKKKSKPNQSNIYKRIKFVIRTWYAFQSRYYVHFWANTLGKGMNPLYPPSYGLNSTTTVLLVEWLWH